MELHHDAESEPIRVFNQRNVKQKYGVLEYDFKVDYVPEGDKIKIKIKPMHHIKQIFARLV